MQENITSANMRNEKSKIIGLHTIRKYALNTKEALQIDKIINNLLQCGYLLTGRTISYWLAKLELKREKVYKNIIVTAGRNVLAGVLANDYVADAYINYGALGDSGTTPTIGNTTLNNETTRKLISSAESNLNVAEITQYWASGEANDHHYEAGEFIAATAIANSGVLFSHWLMDEEKTSAESMTIESQYTFTQ